MRERSSFARGPAVADTGGEFTALALQSIRQAGHERCSGNIGRLELVGDAVEVLAELVDLGCEHLCRLAVVALVIKRLSLTERELRAPGPFVGHFDRVL